MRVFLSHVSEEAPEARALKKALEKGMPGVDVFVSAVDIHLGQAWLKEIDKAMTGAKAVLALCSRNSVRRPWLNFESESGWSKRLPVVPICHKGMRKEQLPDPMHIFQAIELTSARLPNNARASPTRASRRNARANPQRTRRVISRLTRRETNARRRKQRRA
jgi:hypothetical protein